MGLKVAKFGGSSLADGDMLAKVIAIIKDDPQRQYIIPSAPGKRHSDDQKVTDLFFLCHAAASQKVPFSETFQLISDRYHQIIEHHHLTLRIEPYLEEIYEKITNGASIEYTVSRGEYLNGMVLAELLGYDMVDPAEMIFFDEHGRFLPERTNAAVASVLADHKQAVIPGYYGTAPDGSIRTFSRGGSDITGAVIARAVEADVYENWTDVSGLLMASPLIVDQPKPIDKVTYRELRELAYMGANVLHDEAIFPVRIASIPVNIRNTNYPDHIGTTIVPDDYPIAHTGTITGIAGRKDFTAITIEKALMNAQRGFGRRLLHVLEVNDVSFEHLPSGIDTMSVIIADSEVNDKIEKIIEDIQNELQPDSIEIYPDMALVATVGRGMARTPGMSAKLFGSLGKAGVNIRMIDQGSSELNIIVGIAVEDFEKAVLAIYGAFVD